MSFSSWCLVLSVTPEKLQAVAAADPGRLLTGMGEQYLGELGRHALNLLVVTSLFAAALGFANNIARYLFAVARDGLIPAVLGKVHPQHGSPYVACIFLTCIFIVVIGAFALAGLDPLLNLATSLSSMGGRGLDVFAHDYIFFLSASFSSDVVNILWPRQAPLC